MFRPGLKHFDGLIQSDVTINNIAAGALEFEEREESFADALRRIHFERGGDERVEVPNSDFSIAAARIETALE